MEFLKLYEEENRDILYSMSWLNKNSIFDKSIGSFKEIDLFTFLENISKFDYKKDTFYDDIYYILEYTKDSILHLINNINKEIKREHKIIPISQAKEFDKKTILWLSRQDGRTIKEKLKNNKIKAVKRYRNVDTYENRIFKIFLKKIILVEEKREYIQSNDYLISKIRQWLRSDDAKSINEYGNIVYNNILLHHPHYSKVFKSYKWINRLDEKVNLYSAIYIKQLKTIIKFEILTQLQFSTDTAKVLPNTLNKNDLYDININNSIIKIDLENYILHIKDNIVKDKLSFKSIREFSKYIITNQIKLKYSKNRVFDIDDKQTNEIYIDLFRLFPIAKIDTEIVNFPITLQQNIDGKIVNANNTKVINLNHEVYTLPEILKTYDTKILRVFLENYENSLKNKQLNYIIPDYVNIFEFIQVKKMINSYFPNNRNIPKSILAGLKYLFAGELQENDTLVYIQKNHDNDLYVTPLLVKYDKLLQNITNGLYLEKHPTKRIQEESDIIDELNRHFKDEELSQRLLSKFLQNGIKGIKKEQIPFYLNEEVIYLSNTKNLLKPKDRTAQVKSLFPNKKLFKKKNIEIKDTNEDNLNNFERLFKYERDGHVLWREHLPRLAMGNMPMDGYFGEFILVDDNSKVVNNIIEIKNHFSIPATITELSFPLIFGEENINFEAYITSNEFPLKEDLECELELTYAYEAEAPYELTFIALDNSIKPLKVKWRKIQNKDYSDLPIPDFPARKNWDDFKKFPKEDGKSLSDLLDWIKEKLKLLKSIDNSSFLTFKDNEIRKYNKQIDELTNKRVEGEFIFGKNDRNEKFFCFVMVDGKDVFCHSSHFLEQIDVDELYEGDTVYLYVNKEENGKLSGEDISFDKSIPEKLQNRINLLESKINSISKKNFINSRADNIKNEIFTLRFPILTIWNYGHSLSEPDVPDNFRNIVFEGIQNAISIIMSKDMPNTLKEELFFFFCCLHKDAPELVGKRLLEYVKDKFLLRRYQRNIAFAIGNTELLWQQELLKEIILQATSIQIEKQIHLALRYTEKNTVNGVVKTWGLIDKNGKVYGFIRYKSRDYFFHESNLFGRSQSQYLEIGDSVCFVLEKEEAKHVLRIPAIDYLEILSIVLWRSKEQINKLTVKELETLSQNLYEYIKYDLKKLSSDISNHRIQLHMDNKSISEDKALRLEEIYQIATLCKHLELLLSLLRSRENNNENFKIILAPQKKLTQKYVTLIDNATRIVIEREIKLESRINLQIDKPETFKDTPDLLYALRVYLSGDSGAAKTIQVIGVSDD